MIAISWNDSARRNNLVVLDMIRRVGGIGSKTPVRLVVVLSSLLSACYMERARAAMSDPVVVVVASSSLRRRRCVVVVASSSLRRRRCVVVSSSLRRRLR